MRDYVVNGVNEALVLISRDLLKDGVWRTLGGFQKETSSRCLEFPYPVTLCIEDPTERAVLIPCRKWNPILPSAESLWMLLGSNNLDELPGHYVKNLYSFSDDGHTWRAGYGSRIRRYNGSASQYRENVDNVDNSNYYVDQLKYVIDMLKKDPATREAMMSIHDPMKDSRSGMVTKDQPCTRTIQFMCVEGEMEGYVTMRSNDLIFGASAVNWTNFTFMTEYVSRILRVPLGRYFHFASNLHVYENKMDLLKEISEVDIEKAREYDRYLHYDIDNTSFPDTIDKMDESCAIVYYLEEYAFKDPNSKDIELFSRIAMNLLKDHGQMFLEWACMFYSKINKSMDIFSKVGIDESNATISKCLFYKEK